MNNNIISNLKLRHNGNCFEEVQSMTNLGNGCTDCIETAKDLVKDLLVKVTII